MNKTELAENYSVPELKYYILHSLGGNANHMKKLKYKDQLVNYAYNRQKMVVDHQSDPGSQVSHQDNECDLSNVYSPELFLQILEENPIKVRVFEDESENDKHVSWAKLTEFLKKSVTCLKNKLQNEKKEVVLLIPFFSEQAGLGLTKSNFWFSLLYLKEIVHQEIRVDYVVVLTRMNQNNAFFKGKQNKEFNVIICDDGIYSGKQMNDTISILSNNPCIMDYIQNIYVCVPFQVYDIFLSENEQKDLTEYRPIIEKEIEEFQNNNPYITTGKNKRVLNKKRKKEINQIKEKYHEDIPFISFHQHNILWKYNIGERVFVCSGAPKEFNKDMDHWFAHKKPDIHSFVGDEKKRLQSISLKEPYKSHDWTICGNRISDKNNQKASTLENPTRFLFSGKKYQDETPFPSTDDVICDKDE